MCTKLSCMVIKLLICFDDRIELCCTRFSKGRGQSYTSEVQELFNKKYSKFFVVV